VNHARAVSLYARYPIGFAGSAVAGFDAAVSMRVGKTIYVYATN
jgi:hypothetical protein